MARSFGDAFAISEGGGEPRVLPLETSRGYRDASGETRDVHYVRHAPCADCACKGCERCSFAGWTIATREATVTVPPGASPGLRIPVDGEPAFVVEIVEPGQRADLLRAAIADYEGKLYTAWTMDLAARRRHQRRWKILGVLALAALAGGIALHTLTKPTAGEPCTNDEQCRSSHCLELRTITEAPGPPRLDGRMCTASCMTDLDCPMLMHCTEDRVLSGGRQIIASAPSGRACIPNGY